MADSAWMYGNPDVVKQYKQNVATRPVPVTSKTSTTPEKKGRKGLARFLPAGGAIGGTLAAGALLAPVTGGASLAAALLALGAAGAAGGALGEIGAEGISGEKISPGKIGKEAAVSGLTSAIPFGGVARGAKLGVEAAKVGGEQAAKDTLVTKALKGVNASGTKARMRSIGAGYGDKLAGELPLDAAGQGRILKVLDNPKYQIKSGSAEKQARQIDKYKTQLQKPLTDIVKKDGKKYTSNDMIDLENKIKEGTKSIALSDKNSKTAITGLTRFVRSHIRSAADIQQAIRDLDAHLINYARNPMAADAVPARVAQITRGILSKDLTEKVPALKALNKEYSDLSHTHLYLTSASAKGNAASRTGGGGGFFSTVAKGDTAQALKNILGKFAQKTTEKINPAVATIPGAAGDVIPKALPSLKRQAVGETIKQLTGQPVVGAGVDLAATLAGVNTGQQAPADYTNPLDASGTTTPGDTTTGTATETQPTYTLQQAMQDAQRDPKNAAQYLAFAKESVAEAAAATKANAPGKAHGIVSAQMYSNAQNGLGQLQQLKQLLGSDSGAVARANVPGQGLPLVGGYLAGKLGTSSYKNLAGSIADMYLRVTTGATANASEIQKIQQHIMPVAGDPPETVAQKLANLEAFFQRVSGGGGDSGASLTEALQSALQGGQ